MKIRNLLMACVMGMAVLGAAGAAQAADVRLFVRHEVADYGTWRKAYDGFATMQKKMGVIYKAVYQSVDDPNDVTIIHDFHSLDKAKAFAASPDLKAAMEKSGVKGAPQIWYTTRSAK
jgi:ABC-type sugar transport system substrate-binding protein